MLPNQIGIGRRIESGQWFEDLAGCQYRVIGVTSSHWLGFIFQKVGYPVFVARMAGTSNVIFIFRLGWMYFATTHLGNLISSKIVIYQRHPFLSIMVRPLDEFNSELMTDEGYKKRFKLIAKP